MSAEKKWDVEKGQLLSDGTQFWLFREIEGHVIRVCSTPEEHAIENGPHRAFGLNGNPFWVVPPEKRDEVLSVVAEFNAAKAKLDGLMASFIKL